MNNNYNSIEALVCHCEQHGINLCSDFGGWTKVALAVSTLGEAGRELFHRLAQMDGRYRRRESDAKYANAMCTNRAVNLGTLFYMAQQAGVDLAKLERSSGTRHEYRRPHPLPRIEVPPSLIPMDLIDRSQSNSHGLYTYLAGMFPADILNRTMQAYRVGATRDGSSIFPQLHLDGKCRTGKIIPYDPATGRRIKERGADWLHARLMRMNGKAASDYNLRQCLFGEHLLPQHPNASVCLAESEKSAVICSMVWPDYLWVATGGKMNFRQEMLLPLAGRKVVVFADCDATADWQEKMQHIPFAANWVFSDWARNEEPASKRDIADLALEYVMQHPEALRQHPPTPQEILARMCRKNPALALLLERGNFEQIAS